MKRVGVTGAAGFIGSNLCQRLLADGYEVVGVDDMSYGSISNLTPLLDDPAFQFDVLDCTRQRPLRAAFEGCDAIAHLAAKKIPRFGGTLSTLEVNVAGVHAACEVALSLDADLVLTSTSDVYGNATPPFVEDGELVIGPPTTKRWAYAVSKMYDEHVALAMADERDLRVTILRLFNADGPQEPPELVGRPGRHVHRVASRRRANGNPRRRASDPNLHLRRRHRRRHRSRPHAPRDSRRGHQPRRNRRP